MVTTLQQDRACESRDEIAARLRIAIARTSRRLRQEADPGLSPSLTSALSTIEAHGPITPSELADRERLARPGVTRIIARLQSQRLVRRAPDPVDARSYRVTITPRGTELLRAARRRSKAFLSEALRPLSSQELVTLAEAATLLDRMLEDGR